MLPGLVEGVQLMREGARWQFYLPSKLAYDETGPYANQALIFEVKLLEVIPAGQ